MNKLINKTTTIDGMMAVSENDLGLKYVQFLPDNLTKQQLSTA